MRLGAHLQNIALLGAIVVLFIMFHSAWAFLLLLFWLSPEDK